MSTAQGKAKSDGYSYSWFLPAPGSSVSATTAPIHESTAKVVSSEMMAMEERAERWRHQWESRRRPVRSGSWSPSPSRLRIGGFAAWNAVAITGAVVMSMRAASIPMTQLGIFGGVWAGISALVWFLPGLLGYRG